MAFSIKTYTKSLCGQCKSGTLMGRGQQETVYCHSVGDWLRVAPETCNSFRDKKEMSMHGMEEIAWLIKTPKNKSQNVGFVKPGEKEHRELLNSNRPSWDVDD